MKKRINLFVVKKQVEKRLVSIQKMVFLSTVLGLIFFSFFLYFSFLQINLKSKLNNIGKDKQNYLNFLLDNKEIEAELKVFKNKQIQLNKFLLDDANFLPYYTLLKDIVSVSSESATVGSILIDKDRQTDFSVNFKDQKSMINFLNFTESDSFLKNFTNLTLTNFTYREDEYQKSQKSYQLKFKGKFKKINEDTS